MNIKARADYVALCSAAIKTIVKQKSITQTRCRDPFYKRTRAFVKLNMYILYYIYIILSI